MGKKLDKVVEGYKPIPMKRMFYPRKFNLSEDFVNAFHREFDRLVGEGQNPKSLVQRFGKALSFHQNESRRYHKLDEESANKRAAEEKAAAKKRDHKKTRRDSKSQTEEELRAEVQSGGKPDPHEGDRGEAKRGERY
tara:strand:- start:3040 stop:3450 length:411 start_codon:yes stop_codon:yes gene_type:complete